MSGAGDTHHLCHSNKADDISGDELLVNRNKAKEKLDVFEAKIEESEKASSCQESKLGHLACAASALPLSYDNRTTTIAHNLL